MSMKKEKNKFVSQGNTFEILPGELAKPKDPNFIKNKIMKKIVFLWEDEAEMFIKSFPPPNGKTMAKIPPDGLEFKIASDSDPVVRALAAQVEVSEEDYNKNKVPELAL